MYARVSPSNNYNPEGKKAPMREKCASLAYGVQVPDYFHYRFLKGNFFNNQRYPRGIWHPEIMARNYGNSFLQKEFVRDLIRVIIPFFVIEALEHRGPGKIDQEVEGRG